MDRINIKEVEKQLGYKFKKKHLLKRALTRKDAVDKNQVYHKFGHQGIFATPGDAILKAIIVDNLIKAGYDTAGKIKEKKMTLENRKALARISENLLIGNFMLMSNGEKKKQINKQPKPLAETLEAIIGAVYLDCGFIKTCKSAKLVSMFGV